ncbi:TRPM8 channel-associated factor homolog isoform X2 [Xenopus tropicalis]|nr:TRPM8 channel-associated factor homolog isoform X2 [Xenopus tropicalis]XP_031754968.1 TRPM8 channel-associated factor homolog isoform X2 [Xenopus tropicalis]XP_031754969.1 TRPM8 channel-associated factor homolog isoform X2 [Xenopus tropicalis]|eukprot:XP_002934606.1 PREDICTED: TRPM8 channel-associated factor homolog isoform X2 [Xenopus tropicalis]
MELFEDYKALTKDVGSLDFSGSSVPCKLLITGDMAFPVLVTPRKDVLIAASYYGKGKMVVIAHENYLNMKEFMVFLRNSVTWLKPNPKAEIGVDGSLTLLAETLTGSGCQVQTSLSPAEGLGVFCTSGYDDSQAQQIISFVREGGGLLIGAQAWHWSYSHKQENVLHNFPGNKITSVSGVYFTDNYGEKGTFCVTDNMPWTPLYTDFDFSADMKHLLNGVSQLDISGYSLPSDLLIYGALAFPVGVADKKECFLGAAHYGKGRVVVASHDTYMYKPELKTFILNTISWLDTGKKNKIGIHKDLENLAQLLEKEGILCTISSFSPELSVYCCPWYTEAEECAIHQFVAEGGGLFIGGQSWNWASKNSDLNVVADFPGNKILNKFGISILDWSTPQGNYKAVNPDEATNQYRFPKALSQLQNELKSEHDLKPPFSTWMFKLRRDITYFMRLPASPIICAIQRQFIDMMQTCELPKLNGKNCVSSCSKEALILSLAHEACNVNQECNEKNIMENEPAVTIEIDATNPGYDAWRSTGLYLSPKKTAVLVFPASAVQQGLQVQVGCHSDDLGSKDEFYRAPIVVRKISVHREKVQVSCYWGGLLYIIVKERSNLGTIPVQVYGAEPAPTYIKGKTSLDSWLQSLRDLPPPWAELITENIILTVPSDAIRSLNDPEELLGFWDRMMVAITELAAIPTTFSRPERIVADVQISAGWMHAGYPVMVHLASVKYLTNLSCMQKEGLWGPIHELGHNQQQKVWEFPPHTTEATCNLWSVFVNETVVGVPRDKANSALEPASRAACIEAYLKTGPKLENWNVWTALETYLQLQEGFGWEPFKQLFKDYQSMSGISNDNKSKMNLWAEKFSEAVQTNLIPFFEAWGWPIEEETRSKLSALPVWEKDPMKPYLSAMKS